MEINEIMGRYVLINNPKYHPKPTASQEPFKVVGITMTPDGYCASLNSLDVGKQIISPLYSQYMKYLKPIPLTSKYVTGFGYKNIPQMVNAFDALAQDYTGVPSYFGVTDSGLNFFRKLKIHELQNLWQTNTGQELTLN